MDTVYLTLKMIIQACVFNGQVSSSRQLICYVGECNEIIMNVESH